MKKQNGHVIAGVVPESIAEELELQPGDRLIAINGKEIADIFDYRYMINNEELTLTVITKDNEEWELEIEKDYSEDLGIEFESGLMDEYRSCRNKCMFCFIDQMPPGMRKTLYFKDDDARLSFLQGNYVTLTNMSDDDVERICFYKLSPINISIHTTNKELRCKMLSNRFAGDALRHIKRFCEAGIEINGQIVLCRGINDNAELDRTLRDIEEYIPSLKSLSVVPVGLTKYRENLYPLEPFNSDDAKKVLEQIRKWQSYYLSKYSSRIVHASDEWYLLAGEELPTAKEYEGYPQVENGVGMLRSLLDEFEEEIDNDFDIYSGKLSVVTGLLAYDAIKSMTEEICRRNPGLEAVVYPIRNDFFGELITVAGLVTGQDIINQLKGKELGEYLLLPASMLRCGENVLLDDVTVEDLEKALQIKVRIVQSSGASFIEAFCRNFVSEIRSEGAYE